MNAQHAIERVLQDFTKELLKVFSDAVVQAVSQVGNAGAAALPASSQSAPVTAAAKRAPKAPAAPAPPKAPAARAPAAKAAAPKAAPKAVAPKAPRPGVLVKSTPDQVNRLSERLIDVLRKSARNLAAKEIMRAMGLRTTDEGRFQYALNKLKEDGVVQQHGERRQARYGIGSVSKPKAKRGPGRPRKVQPSDVIAEVGGGEAVEATADESLSNG
jgi:hypothetical protein